MRLSLPAAALAVAGLIAAPAAAQVTALYPPSPAERASAPLWARWMYSDTVPLERVDAAYRAWRADHPRHKDAHTQYHQRWRRQAGLFGGADGRRDEARVAAWMEASGEAFARTGEDAARPGGALWAPMGPMRTHRADGSVMNQQANVYSITECAAAPNVLYAGTEPGEVYQSTDGGLNWLPVSQGYRFSGVEAVAVDPTDPQVCFAANGWNLMRTVDGGLSWQTVLTETNLWPHEILVVPTDPDVVLVAGDAGIFRSADGGDTWLQVLAGKAWDLKMRPGSTGTVHALRHAAALERAEFWTSADTGRSFSLRDNGWYASSDPDRFAGGGRLAVTPADPDRVYAYLIGQAKDGDHGYIGVYRSDDGGDTWTLPNGPAGGPYDEDHPNLAIGWVGWNYHQGFYNCALAASPTDPDRILVGGLNLWKSDDGGASFEPVAGYVGGYLPMHVDMQDFRVTASGTWITNDGGITFSSDFYASDFQVRQDGLHASDYWGFGKGWNEDVSVGGLYHNGVSAWREGYGPGQHLQLGGAEPPSGYVNPGNNALVYSEQVGAATLPQAIGQPIAYGSFGLTPNESYWSVSSSEMVFDPRCYGVAWVGRDQQLWRSTDAGASFNLAWTFPGGADAEVRQFEIAHDDPAVFYVAQAPASGTVGRLWKSTDGGASFSELALPGTGGNRNRILLAVDPADADRLVLGFASAASKVWRSTDGGASWTEWGSGAFGGEELRALVFAGATGGGVYAATDHTVRYRDDAAAGWTDYGAGLPAYANINRLEPFYRDARLRLASYGKGVWDAPMATPPGFPLARAMVDRLEVPCASDTFRFEDHSVLVHAGASWAWSFEGGTPATETARNPAVTFSGPGTWRAVLTVTDSAGQADTDTLRVTVLDVDRVSVAEDFEGLFPPPWWTTRGLNAGTGSWQATDAAGGYGASARSAASNNYDNDLRGGYGDLRCFTDLAADASWLRFDVAYAPWGGSYSDTLEVLVSTDCGASFQRLYRRGGTDLATAPAYPDGPFVPAAAQWRTDSVDLSALAGTGDAMLVFRNIGRWGQWLYLDNVNLDGTPVSFAGTAPDPAQAARLVPNPAGPGQVLRVLARRPEPFTVRFFDAAGRTVAVHRVASGEGFTPDLPGAGAYPYRLESPTHLGGGVLLRR